jgi:soluble lytic murein transglycosylase
VTARSVSRSRAASRATGRAASQSRRRRTTTTGTPPRGKRRRGLILIAAVAVGVAGAFGISRIDEIGDPLRELTLPLRHDDIIRQQARDKDLDPALIAAVIYAESRFQDQTSHAGARGLMQITPETAEVIERESGGTTFVLEDLADPDINIAYGSFYLAYLIEKYGGNEVAALAAYNAGETRVDGWGGGELEIEDIGFDETHAYVEQVLDKRGEYRDHYADDLAL